MTHEEMTHEEISHEEMTHEEMTHEEMTEALSDKTGIQHDEEMIEEVFSLDEVLLSACWKKWLMLEREVDDPTFF